MRSKLLTLGSVAAVGTALAIVPAAGAATTKPAPKATKASVDSLAKKVNALTTAFGPVKDNTDFLTAAAPQLVAGLTTLGQALQSPEYGLAEVTTTSTGVTLQTVASYSSDIPDDGNGTTVSGTALMFVNLNGANAGAGLGQKLVNANVSVVVHSAESDVDGSTGPVAEAGGFLYVESGNSSATLPDGTTSSAGTFNPLGRGNGVAQLMTCQNVPGGLPATQTPAGASIQTPTGPNTSLQLVNLDTGVGRTSTVTPADADPAVKTITPGCAFTGTPGVPYIIHYSATFVDIPTSTSPGPRD